jgi:serine/threonine protein kinase
MLRTLIECGQHILALVRVLQLWFSRSFQRLFLSQLGLQSVTDLQPLCEHFTINEEDGDREFLHSSFAYVTKSHAVYYGQSSSRKYDLTTRAVGQCLRRVPDKDVYPLAPSYVTQAAHRNGFFKGPMLTAYDELQNTGQVAAMLLQEAEIFDRLKIHPHPNIIQYHGCKILRGRIVGLVLEKYPTALEDYLRQGVDVESGFSGIKRAVKHLHSLSLAHNDIKSSNIMVGIDGTWVLIDMGSCLPFGATLTSAGTSEWYDESWTTSEQQHDEVALRKLWIWLNEAQSCEERLAKDL